MKKISFVSHGLHLNKFKIEHEAAKHFSKDYIVSFKSTKSKYEAEVLAEESVIEGTDYLIAVGGDGTMHEAVNGIMRVPKEKRKNLAVGLLPVGSGNDFARTLNLSKNISDLYRLIDTNSAQPIDVGKLEFKNMKGEDALRYFINITDVGLGAEVAKRVNEGNKTYGPTLSFFASTLNTFLSYQRKKVKISSDEFNWCGSVLILCLANAKYFGSGLCVAPHAKIDDGKIAVTLAGEVSLFDYLKNLSKIRKGVPIKHPGVIYKEIENCCVEPIGRECLIEADGEMIGKIPLKVSMLHKELKFLYPQ